MTTFACSNASPNGTCRFRLAAAWAGAVVMSPAIDGEATVSAAKLAAGVGPIRLRPAAPTKVAAVGQPVVWHEFPAARLFAKRLIRKR